MKVRRNLPSVVGLDNLKNNNMQQLISTYRKCDGEFIGYSVIHEIDGEVIVITPLSESMIIDEFNAIYRTEDMYGYHGKLSYLKDIQPNQPFIINNLQTLFYLVENSYVEHLDTYSVRTKDTFKIHQLELDSNLVVIVIIPNK